MDKTSEQTFQLEPIKSLHWFHWFVLLASMTLTIVAWYVARNQNNEQMKANFDYKTNQVVSLITERMQKYEDALWSGVAAVHLKSDGIDYIEWKRFADTLNIEEKYPGINGIGIIYYVAPENLEAYLTEQRLLRPEYGIHPEHNRGEYWPITYVEPFKTNAKAVGLDMAFEDNRYTAAKNARDTGEAQITGPIVLVQDSQKTPGFLFYVPFYEELHVPDALEEKREKFIGMVYAPFITSRLIEGTLEKSRRQINIRLRDKNEVIFDEFSTDSEDLDPNPLFSRTVDIPMYGRIWSIDMQTSKSFRELVENNKPKIILLGGLFVEGMLLWIFLLIARSNKKALSLANNMTQKIKEDAAYTVAITNSVKDGLITIDSSGIIQTFNPAASSIFGYDAEEVIGQNVKVLMPDHESKEHDTYLQNFLSTGQKKIIDTGREVIGKRKDGSTFPMDLSISEIQISNSKNFVGVVRDITERKVAENKIKTAFDFQNLIKNSIPDYLFVKDRGFRIVQANDSFLNLYPGYMRDNILGTTTLEKHDEAEAAEFLKHDKMAFEEGYSETEETVTFPDGLVKVLLTKKVKFEDINGEEFILGIARDITEMKKVSAERERLISKLKESNEDLDSFAYVASHDLKAPLRVIDNASRWLEEDLEQYLDDDSKENMAMLRNRVSRMERLLDDLLEYSRVGKKLGITYEEPINARDMLDDVLSLLSPDDKFEINISNEFKDIEIMRMPLQQIFYNLIGNALKHHDHDKDSGKIDIGVIDKDDFYEFTVADDGPGIPIDFQKKIFDLFQTLKPRDEVEGSGMGLAIIKKQVQSFGGAIEVKSNKNEGVKFIFTFPKRQDKIDKEEIITDV